MALESNRNVPADVAPPDPEEVEVSLFGPGLGEAIAVHAGHGDWLLVDSCFDDQGDPAALAYLARIGIDPTNVRCLVATHWDDDHIGGLSRALEACTAATFACSSAVRTQEFLVLTESVGSNSLMTRSGVSEFAGVLATLKTRRAMKQRFAGPLLAIEGRPVWRRAGTDVELEARLTALAPSDAGVALAQRALAQILPQSGEAKQRIRSPSPNRTSVVLQLEVGAVRVLLGADLETTSDPSVGWLAILDGMNRPDARASAFKIPHHGSADADEPRVWDELLEVEPVAVLTPFTQGNVALPRAADRRRLLSRSPDVFTTSAQPRRRRRHDAAVDRTLRESGIVVRDADQPMGHVRLRRRQDAEQWSVDLFGPARRLPA